MNDTVSNHYKAAICLTTRAGCGSKNKFPLPAETNWFDIYIVADKPDCSDDETVWLDLTMVPFDKEDKQLQKISIPLGIYDPKELKRAFQKIADTLLLI